MAKLQKKKKLIDPALEPNIHVSKKKKIGFISSIMLVIGSSVGAGIFIKNWNILNNTQGALFYAILSWIVAIIGILALAFALIEICSGSGKANSQGIVGWVREFNGKFLYRTSKNFMAYLHIPIIYVMMPIYMIMVSQQAFGYFMPWWGCALITFAIGIYHIWFIGFFSRAANISNWIVSIIEFAPILFACVSGFIVLATHGMYSGANWFKPYDGGGGQSPIKSFAQMSLVCGVLSSIPAVFFSFDGFYSAAGLQTEMRDPHKMPKALTVGVTIVACLEIVVSTSLLIGCQDGSLFGLTEANSPFPSILIQIMMVCVFIGMLSVITGNAVFASRFYESLIIHDEIPHMKSFKKHLSTDRPIVGSIYATVLFLVVFLITFGIGPFFWDIGNYANMKSITGVAIYAGGNNVSNDMANVLSFVDTYANWNALFAFVCVTFAIVGALHNRRTNKVKVEKSKVFIPAAIIAILVVGAGIIFVFISTFANFGMSLNDFLRHKDSPDYQFNLIGSIVTVVMLFSFLGVTIIATFVRGRHDVHKPHLKHH